MPTFQDEPLAQDYLYYIQDQIQKGTPYANIVTPEKWFLNRVGGDSKESNLAALQATDPRLDAIRRIYALLGQKGV